MDDTYEVALAFLLHVERCVARGQGLTNVRPFPARELDASPLREYIVSTTREGRMKARLVRIGNSRGIRLPKPLIEEAGLKEEVLLRVRDGAVIITSSTRPRSGWADAARRIRERDEDKLLDEPTSTEFDRKEWRWR